jgi:hypothetical protein
MMAQAKSAPGAVACPFFASACDSKSFVRPLGAFQFARQSGQGLHNLPEKVLPLSISGANWSQACSIFR